MKAFFSGATYSLAHPKTERLTLYALAVWLLAAIAGTICSFPAWRAAVHFVTTGNRVPPARELLGAALGLTAAFHVILATALIISRRYWQSSSAPATISLTQSPSSNRPTGKTWWALLVFLVIAALAERAPRMNDSLWGDEALALYGYVTGHLKPKDPAQRQGPLHFTSTPWSETILGDDGGGGNNHYLYSILGRLTLECWRHTTGQPRGAISEPLLRLWPLVFGLGALVLLALWLKRLGFGWTGLLAAGLLALHPWHLRFSTEARGYAVMLPLFVLVLWSWTNALERGRWRDWMILGAVQAAALYSWKGTLYPIVSLNLFGPAVLWLRGQKGSREVALGRWLAVNCLAAAAFIPLVAPAQIQIKGMIPIVAHHGNDPLSPAWLENLCCESLLGYQARTIDPGNPVEVSLERWTNAKPLIVPIAAACVLAAVIAGLGWLFRRRPSLAGMLLAVPAGGLLAVLHFKLMLGIELLRWYWFFLCPVLAMLAAVGASLPVWSARFRVIAGFVLFWAYAVLVLPMHQFHLNTPYENFRGALELARGPGYQAWHDTHTSSVKTLWLWRFPKIYDPRATNHADTPEQLWQEMSDADRRHLEFYLIDGYPALSHTLIPEVQLVLDDPRFFQRVAVFHGQLPPQSLWVYHYKAGSAAVLGPGGPGTITRLKRTGSAPRKS